MGWKEISFMKQKVSDYIADYIANWGIRDVFTVTGGGAQHMNDAFGHHPERTALTSTTNRHVRWQPKHMHVWITVWQQSA